MPGVNSDEDVKKQKKTKKKNRKEMETWQMKKRRATWQEDRRMSKGSTNDNVTNLQTVCNMTEE